MRISSQKFSVGLTLFLLVGLMISQTSAQSCKIINEESIFGSKIFVSTNEIAEFFLDDWFEGSNLTFTLNSNDDNPIEQPLKQKGKSEYNDTYDTIIDTDFYQKSNGVSLYSMLYADYIDSAQQDQQFVVFGVGDNDTPFPYDFGKKFPIPESQNLLVQCLDILSLNEDTVVVDCIKRGQKTTQGFEYLTKFFILNRSDSSSFTTQEFNQKVTDGLDTRRSELYQYNGLNMIIQGNFEDEFYEPSINFPKLCVYVYNPKKNSTYPQGSFDKYHTISFADFRLEKEEDFQPTDFDVFGDYIYVVEKYFGLLIFKFDGDKVIQQSVVKKSFASLLINWSEAWAISISAHGAFTQVVLVGKEELLVARFIDVVENVYFTRSYDLPFITLGTPDVQTNARYVLVRAGQLLAVYDTGDANSNQFHSLLRGVESFELLSSNLLHVYYASYYVSYVIQEPVLELQGSTTEIGEPQLSLTITAESRYYTKSQQCSLTITRQVVAETELGPIEKSPYKKFTYEFDDELEKDIYLDEQFAGPNLKYIEGVAKGHLLVNGVPNEEDLVEIDTPSIVKLILNPEVDSDNEIYSKILNAIDTSQLQLRQLQNFTVLVHRCLTYFESKQLVSCTGAPVRYDLGGRILHLCEGQIDDNLLVGLVTENSKSTIQFRQMDGHPLDVTFQDPEIGNIKDFIMMNQLLYVLGENNSIGLYKMFRSKLERVALMNQDYVKDWPLTGGEAWEPAKLNAHFSLKNYLFIELKRSTVVATIENDHLPIFVSQILGDPVNGYRGFLSPRSYSVLSAKDKNLKEYSLSDLTDITLTNTFQKYNFSFYEDVTRGAVIANFTQNLYILGYAPALGQAEKQPALLIYKTQQNNFEQLYSVIMLQGLTRDKLQKASSIQFSADGRGSLDFVLLNVDGVRILVRVPVRPRLIVLPDETYPKFQYASTIDFRYNVLGMNSKQQENVTKTIVFINPQKTINLNEEEINNSEFSRGIELALQKQPAIPLQSEDWYNGPVLSKSLSCPDCLGDASGKNLIRLKNKAQELDESQIPPTHDIKQLDKPAASFFYPQSQKLFFVTEEEQVLQFSGELLEAITATDLGLNPVFDDCYELLPCQNETVNPLYSGQLLYAAAVCKSFGRWVVSVVQYFSDPEKAEHKGVFDVLESHQFVDAKCIDSKLYFLDYDETKQTSSLLVYDLYNDVAAKNNNLTLLTSITKNELSLEYSTPFTAFDVVKLGKARKILLTESSQYLVLVDFDDASNSVTLKDGKPLVERLDVEEQLRENLCYVKPQSALLNIRVLREYERKSKDETREYVHALLVVEGSPIYQIELVLNKQDLVFLEEEWLIYKVYQNYGEHKVQRKLSISDGYFAASFLLPSQLFTVVVYQILNDISGVSAKSSPWMPAFEQVWGGREFDLTYQDPESAYLVYFTQDKTQKQYGFVIPSPNDQEDTVVMELNDDDYLLVTPGLVRSQELRVTLNSQFATKKTSELYGFIEPIGQFDVQPYCEVINDQYMTPTILYNSQYTREEYILGDVFRGFNLTYTISSSSNKDEVHILENSFEEVLRLAIPGGRQTVLASDQIIANSGLSTVARLSMTRTQQVVKYSVQIAQEKDSQLNFEFQKQPVEIFADEETTCFDLEFISHQVLVVYCVQEQVKIFGKKYYDLFYVVQVDEASESERVKRTQGLELRMNGTITSGKIMFYDDPQDRSVTYLVTAPFFDSRPAGSPAFDDYVRIYQYAEGEITSSADSTIVLKDVLGSDLTLADFDILDEVIYLLDFNMGIFSFTYDYQSTTKNVSERFQKKGVFQNHVRQFNYKDGFGLDVDYDGGRIIIAIAEYDRVLLFHQNRGNFGLQPTLINTYDSDLQLDNRPDIQVSNKYIGVRSGQIVTVYRRDTSPQSVVSFEDAYSFNLEYQETLFLWGRDELRAYTLQTPYMWIKSLNTTRFEASLNITVISNNTILGKSVNCTIRLETREIDRNSVKVYNTKAETKVYPADNPFEDKNIPIDVQIVGPNIEFDLIEFEDEGYSKQGKKSILGDVIDDTFDVEYEKPEDCFYDKVELDSSQTIFSRMVAVDNSEILLIHQLKDFSLLFRRCSAQVGIYVNVQCKNISVSRNLNSSVTEFVGGFYGGVPTVVIVQASEPDTLHLFSHLGVRTKSKKIADAPVSSLVLNSQLLFFISNRRVFIIDTANSESTRAVIDELLTKFWKIPAFDPIELEAHEQDGNILVIRQIGSVLVVNVESKTPILISEFSYNEGAINGEVCESHLAPKAFVVNCGKKISTFSLLNLKNITLLNVLPTYKYRLLQIKNKSLVVGANYSGLLYALGEDSGHETFLLIYRSHSQHVRSLYQAIELPSTEYNGSEPLQFTVSGYTHVDFVYISIGAREYFFRVPHNHQFKIRPGWLYPITEYSKEYSTKLEARGMDMTITDNTLKETLKIQFYNPQTRLLVDQDAIDNQGLSENDGLEMTSDEMEVFKIPTERFVYGPNVGFSIECSDCPGGMLGTGVITLQNKVSDISSTLSSDLNRFKDVQGAFQSKENKNIYILNNKRVFFVQKIGFEIISDMKKLNIKEDAECISYLPCYESLPDDSYKLKYTIAICREGSKWVAAPMNYSQSSSFPSALDPIYLDKVENFVQAQCSDQFLLVMHTKGGSQPESVIDVYNIYADISSSSRNATLVRTYDKDNLYQNETDNLVMTGFEVTEASEEKFRRIFISFRKNLVTSLELHVSNYTLIHADPVQLNIRVDQRFKNRKLYFPGHEIEIVSVKVLGSSTYNKTTEQGIVKRFHTRVLVVLKNLPLAEFMVDSPMVRDFKDITIDHFQGLYDHVGDSQVSSYVSVSEKEFVVQYYQAKKDTLVFALYQKSTELNFEEDNSLSHTHIFGGYNMRDIYFYEQESPVPVLVYSKDPTIIKPEREVAIFLPSPQSFDIAAKILSVKPTTTITAKNSNFYSQNFVLIPDSIYAKIADEILGIITPFDPEYIKIETQPYCKILDDKFEQRFKLWNSIGKVEQYLLDDIIEGYNLSFSIDDPLDRTTKYEIFDTLQEMDRNDFDKEDIKEVVEITTLYSVDTETQILRLGVQVHQQKTVYAVTFFDGSQSLSPNLRQLISIDVSPDISCFSAAFISKTDAVVYCNEFVSTTQKAFTYRNVFFILQDYDQSYSVMRRDTKETFLLESPIESAKTVAYQQPGRAETYLVSAPLIVPREESEISTSQYSYLCIYEYKAASRSISAPQKFNITSQDLGLYGPLIITDLQVYNGRIYVLDLTQGLISFEFDASVGVQKLSSIPLVGHGIRFSWGLLLKQYSAFTGIYITTRTELLHFVQPFGEVSGLMVLRFRYELEDELISRPVVQSSGKYIGIQIKSALTIYERGVGARQRVFRSIPKVQGFNLFPDNYLYVWQKHGVISYLLEQPHLNVRALEDSGAKFPVLTATSWNRYLDKNQTCSISFNPKNIDSSSQEVRKVFDSNQPFFETSSNINKDIRLNSQYAGPNLRYEMEVQFSSEILEVELDVPEPVEFTYPAEFVKESIFDRIIQITDTEQVQIHQTPNFLVQLFRCNTNFKEISTVRCSFVKNLTEISSKITVFTHGLYNEEPSFLIVEKNNQKRYYQYLYTGKLQSSQSLEGVSMIIDLELALNTLFILDMEMVKGEIRVYSTLSKVKPKLLSVIDDTYATKWGIEPSDFIPRSIVTHYNYQDLLLIEFEESLVVVSTQTSVPQLINVYDITGYNISQVNNFALTANFLWNIGTKKIFLHDIRDEEHLSVLYALETYTFEHVVPDKTGFQFAAVHPSNFIYVAGQKITQGQPGTIVLLIYRETAQNIQNLYKVIETGIVYNQASSSISLAADSASNVDFVSLNVNGQIFYIRVPHDPTLLIQPGQLFPRQGYSSNFTVGFQVVGMDGQISLQEKMEIIIINPQTEIFINQTAIEEASIRKDKGGIRSTGAPNEKFVIEPYNWFSGPILSYEIDCPACETPFSMGSVSIQNRIYENPDKSFQTQLEDLDQVSGSFVDRATGNLFFLSGDYLQIFSSEFKLLSETLVFKSGLPGQRRCFQLLPSYSSGTTPGVLNYVVAICEQRGQLLAAPVNVKNIASPDPNVRLLFLNNDSGFQEAQCFNEDLLVLQNGMRGSRITAYNLIADVEAGEDASEEIISMDLSYLRLKSQHGPITSFQAVEFPNSQDTFKLIISQENNFLGVVGMKHNTYQIQVIGITKENVEIFDLMEELKNKGVFIKQSQKTLNIKSINQSNVQTADQITIDLDIIVMIQQAPILELSLVIFEDIKQKVLKNSTLDLNRVFSQYGDGILQRHFSYVDNYLAAGYYSTETSSFVVALYDDSKPKNLQSSQKVPSVPMLGGVEEYAVLSEGQQVPSTPFVLFWNSTKQMGLITPSITRVEPSRFFSMNNETYIILKNNKFTEQEFYVLPVSDYAKGDELVTGYIIPLKPDVGDDSYDYGWVIAVSVIGGVALLGGLGYFFWRKRQQQQRLLDDDGGASEGGMSLQENTNLNN